MGNLGGVGARTVVSSSGGGGSKSTRPYDAGSISQLCVKKESNGDWAAKRPYAMALVIIFPERQESVHLNWCRPSLLLWNGWTSGNEFTY